jgi:RNA recognition motif-containing protein
MILLCKLSRRSLSLWVVIPLLKIQIRETPHKRHHKFIEFYDVRAAEAALRALNKSDIAGKRIKLEPSRPGGARRK